MRRGMGPLNQTKNPPNSKHTTPVTTAHPTREGEPEVPHSPSTIIKAGIAEVIPQEGSPKEIHCVDNLIQEDMSEEILLGKLDLEGLEVAGATEIPESIPPQQVSLLGEAILKSKTVKALGIVTESLKECDGKKKG